MAEHKSIRNYKYDVALSYSGKDPEIARKIALALQDRGVKVFYDEWAKADLWGKDLHLTLHRVFTIPGARVRRPPTLRGKRARCRSPSAEASSAGARQAGRCSRGVNAQQDGPVDG